jgi:hypothetical protein
LKQKGGAGRELMLIRDPPTTEYLTMIPHVTQSTQEDLRKKRNAIMVGIHIGVVLMFVGAVCFGSVDGVYGDGLLQAPHNITKLNTMLNKAILRCSSPLAMFTASKGQQLFCQALLHWNQAVAQLAPETMLFSFISGGVLLAGFSQIIQKLKAPAGLTYKAYTFFVMIVAYIILYVSLGLWQIGQGVKEVTNVAYKDAFRNVVGKIGAASAAGVEGLTLQGIINDAPNNVFIKQEEITEEADNQQLSNLAKYGQKVVHDICNQVKKRDGVADADMAAAADALIKLSQGAQGGRKKKSRATPPKKTAVKKPTPKTTPSAAKGRRVSANRA